MTKLGLLHIGRDPAAFEAFYREHFEAVTRFTRVVSTTRTPSPT